MKDVAKHWCNVIIFAGSSNQSCGSVHYCLKSMYVAGGNAIQYGVTVIQPTADERTHQGSPGFERQAAFNAAQLSKLVEYNRTALRPMLRIGKSSRHSPATTYDGGRH